MKYQTIVGNIGTVYNGNNHAEALDLFYYYKTLSKQASGSRCANEPVYLMTNDEPELEYYPDNYKED